VNYPEVWACPQLLTKKNRKSIIQKLGLAVSFWQKKYKVNYTEVWACFQVLAKKIQCEFCSSMACPVLLAKKIDSELFGSGPALNFC